MAERPVKGRYELLSRLGRYGNQIADPNADADRAREQDERVKDLAFLQQQQMSKEPEEKDLTARFTQAFDETAAGAGAQVLDQAPMNAAIMGVKARAAAAVEANSLSPEEKQAKAMATALRDVLDERDAVSATESPDVDDVIAASPDDETFIDEAGDIWTLDADGAWRREDEEEPPQDQWRNDSTGNTGFVDLRGEDDTDNETDWEDDNAA